MLLIDGAAGGASGWVHCDLFRSPAEKHLWPPPPRMCSPQAVDLNAIVMETAGKLQRQQWQQQYASARCSAPGDDGRSGMKLSKGQPPWQTWSYRERPSDSQQNMLLNQFVYKTSRVNHLQQMVRSSAAVEENKPTAALLHCCRDDRFLAA